MESMSSVDRAVVDLWPQQDEDSGRDGENCQNWVQATQTQKLDQAPGDEQDGQQEHAYVSGEVHGGSPFQRECAAAVTSIAPGQRLRQGPITLS